MKNSSAVSQSLSFLHGELVRPTHQWSSTYLLHGIFHLYLYSLCSQGGLELMHPPESLSQVLRFLVSATKAAIPKSLQKM